MLTTKSIQMTCISLDLNVTSLMPLHIKNTASKRADKDPRDYMGMTVDESELPLHFDGFFVGYASHSTVILVYNPETQTVKRCHHGYVDEYNVRVLDTE